MENHQKNIDDLFREELGGYTETPPPAAWEALEKKLGPAAGGFRVPGKRIWYAALLVLVLLLSIPALRNSSLFEGNKERNSLASNENTVPVNQHAAGTPGTNQSNNNPPIDSSAIKPSTNNSTPLANNNPDKRSKNINNDNGNNANNNNTPAPVTANTNSLSKNNASSKPARHESTPGKEQKALQVNSYNNGNTLSEAVASKTNDNKPGNTGSQTENIFNSSLTNPAPAAADEATTDPATNDVKPAAKEPGKEPLAKAGNNAKTKPGVPPKKKEQFNKFELGIKAGFERGFDNDGAKKVVVEPYLQYNLSPKFAIMIQPAIKGAAIEKRRIGTPQSYYKLNDDTVVSRDRRDANIIGVGPAHLYFDTYSQTHDSIVKSYSIGGSYLEFEIPLLLKYAITKQFSVYGGVNLVYGRLIGVREETYTSAKILKTVEAPVILRPIDQPDPPVRPFNEEMTYTGTPVANYTGPTYTSTTESAWKAGYMLGFTYNFNKRWLFDGLVQQTSAKTVMQGGYNVNTALSAPYFRCTLGYKLLK